LNAYLLAVFHLITNKGAIKMARVSHLALRRRIDDEKSKITDKQFFTSGMWRGYLADMAEATGNKYKKPIKIELGWNDKVNSEIAYTDNQRIYINVGHPNITRLSSRQEKHQFGIGLLAHEIGHILFSDFEMLKRFGEALLDGIFYPAAPKASTDLEKEALDGFLTDVFEKKDNGIPNSFVTLPITT